MAYDPRLVTQAQSSFAWSALTRAGVELETAIRWDRDLLREPRVLVPIDVQAYVAPSSGGTELMLRFHSPLSPGAPPGLAGVQGPPPFDAGAPRPAGVHVHWALPDSLLRGSLRDPDSPAGEATPQTVPAADGGGLGMPALPDRWAVLRLVSAADATRAVVRGWVLDAASAIAWELPSYPSGSPQPSRPGESPGPAVPREGLTGAAGGTLTWTGGYDAAFGRFAWHDPLDDLLRDPTLGGALPGGPAGGKATYLVVGWWSDPELDPLDRVRTEGGLAERLAALQWRLLPGGGAESQQREGQASRAATVGLEAGRRWKDVAVSSGARPPASAMFATHRTTVSGLAVQAATAITAKPVGSEASTLLHGALVGVPISDTSGGPDLRPGADTTRIALGDSLDELVATLAAAGLGLGGEERGAMERLLWAFTAHLLPRIGSADGVADLDEARHAAGFTSVDPQEPPETDRVRTGRARIPPRTRRTGGAPAKPGKVTLSFDERKGRGLLVAEARAQTVAQTPKSAPSPAAPPAGSPADQPGEQIVERPAPHRYVPKDPVLAVSGIGRSLRHGTDGRWSADGLLGVRRPSQVGQGYGGLLRGADVLPSLGSGALPPEALDLAREALLLSPHLADWLSRVASENAPHLERRLIQARMAAEIALRYDDTGAYTAAAGLTVSSRPQPGAALHGAAASYERLAAERVRRHSLFAGVEPDPVGVTSWAQPWVPLWLDYELTVRRSPAPDELIGHRLGPVDGELADPANPPPIPDALTFASRVPLTTGPAEALAGELARYVAEEEERDRKQLGEVDDVVEAGLRQLASRSGSLDLMGAALEGVRLALLGLPVTTLLPRDGSGALRRPTPHALPRLATAGTITLNRARVIDAFGRMLDLSHATAVVPLRLSTADDPAAIRHPPRLSAPARCVLRFVGSAATSPDGAVPARVDEIDPVAQVNPVAGFLLPDHADESVEFFTTDGTPVGEVLVEPVGGGVVWEPSPGRPLPHDAPPSAGLGSAHMAMARLAAGLVAADAEARGGLAAEDATPAESALAAFLRAIDTTLWTIDPLAGAGTSAVGGIVGRPLAVVMATMVLDVAHDLDDLELDAAGRAARDAAYRDIVRLQFPVRLGELTRTDDGLIGYYVDGDFTRLHLVNRVVADLAREAGRGLGHLGTWGETPDMPRVDPITHPYLHAEDELLLRPGVPRLVTLLMMPGAAVHATSGVVPRQKARLARAWFAAGLERLSPSVRVGPVLVDPGDVRLPLVAALGEKQTLTTREGPLGWRDDPILAATQAAVLPDRTAVLREGWIRVTPETPAVGDGESGGAS
jgi:hypothetical protein